VVKSAMVRSTPMACAGVRHESDRRGGAARCPIEDLAAAGPIGAGGALMQLVHVPCGMSANRRVGEAQAQWWERQPR
jgi:hypothetical protein